MTFFSKTETSCDIAAQNTVCVRACVGVCVCGGGGWVGGCECVWVGGCVRVWVVTMKRKCQTNSKHNKPQRRYQKLPAASRK